MNHSERKSTWGWIGCAVLLSIPLVILVDRLAEKEPEIILWSDLQYGDPKNLDESIRQIRITEDALKDTIIPEIDFKDEPFLDCLDSLEKAMNENRTGSDTFRIVLEDSVSAVNVPIRLRLTDVPAAEGLRYLTSLAHLKYRVTSEGDVLIVPLIEADELEEGWFEPSPSFFSDLDPFSEKIDVRETLESAGIEFSEGTVANFYPQKGLMWVRNTRDQLEMVDAYTSSWSCYQELGWRDWVHHYWMVLIDGYAPVSTPPSISVTPVPDPFGSTSSGARTPDPFGGSTSGSDEPDPFGGGASSSRSEPDPFK